MGGISSGKPVLPLITGPMMPGSFRGQRIGACTDCRNNWAAYRGDELDVEDIADLNEELAPTAGTCGVMGTASTMACIVAALGLIDLRAGAYVPGTFSNHFTPFFFFFLLFFSPRGNFPGAGRSSDLFVSVYIRCLARPS